MIPMKERYECTSRKRCQIPVPWKAESYRKQDPDGTYPSGFVAQRAASAFKGGWDGGEFRKRLLVPWRFFQYTRSRIHRFMGRRHAAGMEGTMSDRYNENGNPDEQDLEQEEGVREEGQETTEDKKDASVTANAGKSANSEYEDVCFICRRPESKAGKMFKLPNNIDRKSVV